MFTYDKRVLSKYERKKDFVSFQVHGTFFLRLSVCSQLTTDDDIHFAYGACKEVLTHLKSKSWIYFVDGRSLPNWRKQTIVLLLPASSPYLHFFSLAVLLRKAFFNLILFNFNFHASLRPFITQHTVWSKTLLGTFKKPPLYTQS